MRTELKRCERCGLCLSACPIYLIDREEPSSPRGRLHTIDKIKNKEAFNRFLNNCLLCGSCLSVCPNNVDIVSLIRDFREEQSIQRNVYYLMRLAQQKDFELITLIYKILRIDKNLGGLLRLFTNNRSLPRIPEKDIQYNDIVSKHSTAIFTGCISKVFYPQIINFIAGHFNKEGFNVFVPKEQFCCGLMNYSAGDRKKAISLAKKNLMVFTSEKIEKIVTVCASCYHMLKEYSRIIEGGEAISEKLVFLDEILIDIIVKRLKDSAIKIGVHIPCHIRNSTERQIYRSLSSLAMRSNIKLIDICCGNGGVFNLYEYKKSIKIGERILPELLDLDELYTLCSGCYMQIFDLVSRLDRNIGVYNLFHIIGL